jgi:SAM-dependent methyltransferase
MLRYGRRKLPAARADAEQLPVADGTFGAVATMMVHTDMPGYATVLREIARVLKPGGVLLHVGVHPCFCGGFADWSNRPDVLIQPGYLDGGSWTKRSYTTEGVRDKIGAAHFPLPRLLHMFGDAGLRIERYGEGAAPTPVVLAMRARKPRQTVSVGSSGADRLSTAPATAGDAVSFASSARSRTARCDSVSSPDRSTSPITETDRGPTTSSRR